jgi:hypothetical protein
MLLPVYIISEAYVISRVANLTEEKSLALYEISGMATRVSILCQKQDQFLVTT